MQIQSNRFMCKFSVFEINMKKAIVVDLTDQHTKFFSFCSFTRIRFAVFFSCSFSSEFVCYMRVLANLMKLYIYKAKTGRSFYQ